MSMTSSKTTTIRTGGGLAFVVFTALWVAFGLALIFNQGALDSAWQQLHTFPLVVQVILWILFLPVTVGLWIWESDLALWLRLFLVIAIALFNVGAFAPKTFPSGPPKATDRAA